MLSIIKRNAWILTSKFKPHYATSPMTNKFNKYRLANIQRHNSMSAKGPQGEETVI